MAYNFFDKKSATGSGIKNKIKKEIKQNKELAEELQMLIY